LWDTSSQAARFGEDLSSHFVRVHEALLSSRATYIVNLFVSARDKM
jgi:hypothetical protein